MFFSSRDQQVDINDEIVDTIHFLPSSVNPPLPSVSARAVHPLPLLDRQHHPSLRHSNNFTPSILPNHVGRRIIQSNGPLRPSTSTTNPRRRTTHPSTHRLHRFLRSKARRLRRKPRLFHHRRTALHSLLRARSHRQSTNGIR